MNLTIIQELGSVFGNVKQCKIVGVTGVEPADNQELKFISTPQHVIWCKLQNSSPYPLAYFPNTELRDKALQSILHCSSNYILLDYNTYFDVSLIPDSAAKKILYDQYEWNLVKCLMNSIDYIQKNKPAENIKALDAFAGLPTQGLNTMLKLGVSFPINNTKLPFVWAKTLKVDNQLRKLGISKFQVFNILTNLNNESFSNTRTYYY